MSLEPKKQPIVIRRVIRKGGSHGGAWKIAYADFATAMMAFFLLLWILNATDDQQRAAIAGYFQDPALFEAGSPVLTVPAGEGSGNAPSIIDFEGGFAPSPEGWSPSRLEALAQRLDAARLESLRVSLQAALDDSAALAPYKEQLLIDVVPEGLRIQIIDRENRPMFDLGSARLRPHAAAILEEIGTMIETVPNPTAISGHTDARPYTSPDYTNWELSTDRANAARRALIAGGMPDEQVGRIVGLGSSAPADPEHPSAPINRRISIVVMRLEAAEAAFAHDSATIELPGD
ncbi:MULTISPECIES: flagellar motor protein MotB [Marichromatium]|uniref:Chemotaxis protein MotB n=1 Tax=Marichromatium gracile TaxID=1048 RepID=A0A4R4A6X5_MARGR|nr:MULTISPECIES: flagellar motor protein MotB [Marichromatium]MBK1708428.1 flagellar motor protein MotB [Marichromatium gracile]RNE94290.1 motility protein MotB [Marichromatium sp. AB32]TCW34196.1 chemotaxis protein MotB [Marichromatium gracile]